MISSGVLGLVALDKLFLIFRMKGSSTFYASKCLDPLKFFMANDKFRYDGIPKSTFKNLMVLIMLLGLIL